MRPNSAGPNRETVDVSKLDDETEFVIEKFREGYPTMELRQLVKNYVDVNFTQCQVSPKNNKSIS